MMYVYCKFDIMRCCTWNGNVIMRHFILKFGRPQNDLQIALHTEIISYKTEKYQIQFNSTSV